MNLAGAGTGTVDNEKSAIFKIVWFMGLSLLLYMVGHMYTLPEEVVPFYQWALSLSFVALAGCLVWFASNALRSFLQPKVLKSLDLISRGIERLKKILGGGNGSADGGAGS